MTGTDFIMEWRGLRKIKRHRVFWMIELKHVRRPGNNSVIALDIKTQSSNAFLSHMYAERNSTVLRCPNKNQRIFHSQVDSVLENAVDTANRPPGEECRKLGVNLLSHETRRIKRRSTEVQASTHKLQAPSQSIRQADELYRHQSAPPPAPCGQYRY